MKQIQSSKLGIALMGALMLLGRPAQAADAALETLQSEWSTLEQYCASCHNFDDYAGGIDFSFSTPATVAEEAEIFELALKKLRNSVMPPPSQQQPSEEQRWRFISALENALDSHAAAHPNPGRVGLRRLNRTEYVNAVRDILGVELDPELVLPKDDNSDGFDNMANVLKISPSFLDQYIGAARLVSELAVGNTNPRTETVSYSMDPSWQGSHIHGLPLGTRGGVLVEHNFPVEGDYVFNIQGLASAGYVLGMEYKHTVILTVDGERVFQRDIGGDEDLLALDQIQAPAVAEINGRFQNIRVRLGPGRHRIGVAFIARSFAESDEFLHDLSGNRGMGRIARARALEIVGPLDASGNIETPSRRQLMVCQPRGTNEELACAEQILGNVAKKAFRRPISAADLDAPMRFFASGWENGSFDDGIKQGLMAILASPKFLFRAELGPEEAEPGQVVEITDLELASRLAFFLWSSPPDNELLERAAAGQLKDRTILGSQVRRMLADPRAAALVNNFAFQWLRIRDLDAVDPDPEIFPRYNRGLLRAFKEEIALFIQSILEEDRGVVDLMTASHTYLNEELALHYGMTDIRGNQFRRVELPMPERHGLLGKGAVLMVTSYANRTTPVIRGAYIMENIQGVPPAAPPPDVEAFPETPEGAAVALTVRERLEVHRDNPACAGCHDVMDPLGLALENFDAIGMWRDRDSDAGNTPIDSSGRMGSGKPVNGVNDLREALVERPEQFVQTFTEKLLAYSIGRTVEAHDMPAVRKIVRGAEDAGYRFSDIVMGIIESEQFRKVAVPEAAVQSVGSL